MLQKEEKIRLTGKPLAALNLEFHERDNYTCIIKGCDRYVQLGEKWHHEPCGPDKEDVIEKGCLLCQYHHDIRHNRAGSQEVRRQCEEYLDSLYPYRSGKEKAAYCDE